MNLQQLRYICEVVRCNLNISAAAKALGASQPAVSQQIRALEEELGTPIFVRSRSRLVRLTPAGEELVEGAQHVLAEMAHLQRISQTAARAEISAIRVVSSHVQARYALPASIRRFNQQHPGIEVHIAHYVEEGGGPWRMVQNREADIAITTEVKGLPRELLSLPCSSMRRSLVALRGHPLLRRKRITLEAIAQYPLIAHSERSIGRRRTLDAFLQAGLQPNVVVSAMDEDVIKACVEQGIGVSILGSIVFDAKRDKRLGAVDVTALFEPSVTYVVLRRSMVRHKHLIDFVDSFCANWSQARILREATITCGTR